MITLPHSQRTSGILLHPTSLPGPHGIGDLGEVAYRWLDFLVTGKQQLWQILPLGPPGYGESPYAARSAFAGNPLLISLERLAADGLLDRNDLDAETGGAPDRVDWEAVAAFKEARLERAWQRFRGDSHPLRAAYQKFVEQSARWLDDYALFTALRTAHDGAPWNTWARTLVQRDAGALMQAREQFRAAIERVSFIQFIFWRQWGALKQAANALGIRIIGDIPIFVAHDSADVWADQELFSLDEQRAASVVAGVPPDYFSPTGQRWGNPLYRWDRFEATGYHWWIERFRAALASVDLVRMDHFRGFAAYWEVPGKEETALNGRWVKGPGTRFFQVLTAALGPLPIIVEDLGLITRSVRELRAALGYPGMKVLQFAFGDDATNPYLPHNYAANCCVYTGTHDNDTSEGWFATLPEAQRANVTDYLGLGPERLSEKLIRVALASVAEMAIFPLQDVLALGSGARMNVPGQGTGNWSWRARAAQIEPAHASWLGEQTALFGRVPLPDKEEDERSDTAY